MSLTLYYNTKGEYSLVRHISSTSRSSMTFLHPGALLDSAHRDTFSLVW